MRILKKGSRGDDVVTLQKKLGCYPDGVFGALTEEAVRAYQKDNGLEVDGIVGNQTWNSLFPPFSDVNDIKVKKSTRKITEIIVHCSATAEGKDFTVQDIRRWHLARGFSDIGYNYVIYRDGSIHEGRNVNISGAHCTGHNYNSIGVCYIGGLEKDGHTPKDTRTPEQKKSLIRLVRKLMQTYNLSAAKVYGHYQFANKACPSFKIELLRKEL